MPDTLRVHRAGSVEPTSGSAAHGMTKTHGVTTNSVAREVIDSEESHVKLGLKIDAAVQRATADAAMGRAMVSSSLPHSNLPDHRSYPSS